jgi:hypothetical protein
LWSRIILMRHGLRDWKILLLGSQSFTVKMMPFQEGK